ncbi:unnamed protein product [Ectocarpus sp. 4 AP-2014]
MMDDAALFCQHEVRSCWGVWKTRSSLFLPSPLSFYMCPRSLRTPSGSQKIRCITPPSRETILDACYLSAIAAAGVLYASNETLLGSVPCPYLASAAAGSTLTWKPTPRRN